MVETKDRPLRAATRIAAVNDEGRVIGEFHHRAKLSDADVDLILALRDAGLSYGAIAAKFDDKVTVSKQQVYFICAGLKRSQLPKGYRRVPRYDAETFSPDKLSELDITGGF